MTRLRLTSQKGREINVCVLTLFVSADWEDMKLVA